jgi:putative ABC transport system permease protein
MFELNFKIALRTLWKHKGYTLINVGGLAVGLASCMVLLLYVAYEWGYDKQFSNYDKTYVVHLNSKSSDQVLTYGYTPGIMASEIREKVPGVDFASRSSYPDDLLLSYKQKNVKKGAVYADPSFLKILDFRFIKGDRQIALNNPNSVVLTESIAETLFGTEDPINKTVKFQNTEVLLVEAVIEDVPKNSSIQFDYLLPWALYEKQHEWVRKSDWGNNYCLTIMQLKDNRFYDHANLLITNIYKQNLKGSLNEGVMHPLAKWHLFSQFENGVSVGGKIDQIKIFLILAVCILLIACINFMNLSTARSENRAREVGVRKAIGSSRKSLITQFLFESLLLTAFAVIFAFILVEVSLPYFNNLFDIEIAINYSDIRFWLVIVSLMVVTAGLAGSYPAFYLSSFEPVKVLKGVNSNGSSSLSVRKVLVVFQFASVACFIICAVMIYRQLHYIQNKPIGYDREGLIELRIEENLKDKRKLAVIKEQIIKSGAATSVTYFSQSLTQGGNVTYDFSWPGKKLNDLTLVTYRGAGSDFSQTIGSKLIAGRGFSDRNADSTSVIVNKAAVKLMGLKSPVGAVIKWDDTPVTIIGVLEDFVIESPYKRVDPLVIYHPTSDYNYLIAKLSRTQQVAQSVAQIEATMKAFNPDYPVDRTFVTDDYERKLQNERRLGILSNWFGAFAILISCLGLLGLALYIAEQRKKEISIRKVLGASMYDVLTLLNRDLVKLVIISNMIAFPLGYIVINKWLSGYEFRVEMSVMPFLAALGLSILIAVLTVSIQSVKVAKANPVEALKYE